MNAIHQFGLLFFFIIISTISIEKIRAQQNDVEQDFVPLFLEVLNRTYIEPVTIDHELKSMLFDPEFIVHCYDDTFDGQQMNLYTMPHRQIVENYFVSFTIEFNLFFINFVFSKLLSSTFDGKNEQQRLRQKFVP